MKNSMMKMISKTKTNRTSLKGIINEFAKTVYFIFRLLKN